jgi:gluconate 2-dehydrogenase alpha chain
MTGVLPKVDAVCVGMGWAGGILAAELTKAGMSVVGLERGPRDFELRSRTLERYGAKATGGVIVGSDPRTSAVNGYLQMWDYPNVFVVGASAFPQNAGYNSTGTVGALAYRAADGIVNRYRKKPGPLV